MHPWPSNRPAKDMPWRDRHDIHWAVMDKNVHSRIVHGFLFFSHLSILKTGKLWMRCIIHLLTVPCSASTAPLFSVHSVLVSAWECGCYVPGRSLTVCCIGSTGPRLCHSCPSQCLPCSASHSRTCLTLQPLSEMDERRKHILLLWATHTQWAATKCPSTASRKQGKKGLLIASSYGENIQGLTSSCACAIHWLIKTSRI